MSRALISPYLILLQSYTLVLCCECGALLKRCRDLKGQPCLEYYYLSVQFHLYKDTCEASENFVIAGAE